MAEVGRNAEQGRRRFLVDMARGATGAALFGLGIGIHSRNSVALPAQAIRPPGALPEADFLGACVRCGLCVRDCPYDILKLAEPGEDITLGSPYFIAREKPCEMCEDIPCVVACPTGALDHGLTDIDEARMGLAVLVDQETCLNYQGLRCDVCYRVCPAINQAITLELQHNQRSGKHALFIPTVHSDKCTGCGKCEQACVLEEAAIKVIPMHLAKGELGHHYRLGWEEKARAGRSVVAPDVPHQYNLPEGMDYEHGGRGLYEEAAPETPFGNSALETLNRGMEGGQ